MMPRWLGSGEPTDLQIFPHFLSQVPADGIESAQRSGVDLTHLARLATRFVEQMFPRLDEHRFVGQVGAVMKLLKDVGAHSLERCQIQSRAFTILLIQLAARR